VATAGTSAVVAVAATTRGQGRITSAAVMDRVDMVVVDMEAMVSRAEMAMANKVEMAMDRVDMEEMEADTLEEGMVVAAAAAVEGDIRDDGIR
jgi:spore coat protein CotH